MSNPDSTLVFLSQIPDSNKLKGKVQAKYCFLYSAAKFRKYEPQTDSMIAIAANYYKKHGTAHEKAEAYYYMGGIVEEQNDAPQAQDLYLNAYEAGENLKDYSLLGRICGRIGMLYTYQNVYKEALKYQNKSLEYYNLCGDTARIAIALRDIGRTYTMIYEEPDSAIVYYEKALIASKGKRASIWSELGNLYMRKGDYEKAYEYIRKDLEFPLISSKDYGGYLTCIEYFRKTNQYDSAYYYLNKCLKSNNDYTLMGAYDELSKLEELKGDWKKSLLYKKEFENIKYKVDNRTNAESIAKADKLYNYTHKEKELKKAEGISAKRLIIILIFSVVIALLVIAILVLYIYIKRKRLESLQQQRKFKEWQREYERNSTLRIEQNKRLIQELEQQLAQKQTSEAEIKRLEIEKKLAEAENQKIEYAEKEKMLAVSNMLQSDVYQKFHSKNTKKITESDWQDLIAAINKAYPQFIGHIKTLIPNISETEFNICCLVKINLQNIEMAKILNLSSQSVSMIRSRLYKKIHGTNGKAKDFDKFIATI